jgi:regulator of protease activity HflC (stomatin/prohibitin superfamily)
MKVETLASMLSAGAVLALFGLFLSCTPIDAGYVGVQKTFGSVHKTPLEPGLHFVKPFIDSVERMDTRLKSFEITGSAASKDLQVVTTTISVQHSLTAETAPIALASIGDLDAFDVSVVSPAVLESFKAVTAQYTAEELITNRDVVKTQIGDDIQAFIDETLKSKDVLGAIHVANVAIKDFQFSAEFNNSIEAKVKSQQDALKAEIDKKQAVTKAEADARVVELAADAEAYEIEQISTQRAAAIKREQEALLGDNGARVLQLRTVEKWDGKLPTLMPGSAIPFIDVSK